MEAQRRTQPPLSISWRKRYISHERDKWKSRFPYWSCSNFKCERATGQRFLLIFENVSGQGSSQWGSGLTLRAGRCESCLQYYWEIALVEPRKQGFCLFNWNWPVLFEILTLSSVFLWIQNLCVCIYNSLNKSPDCGTEYFKLIQKWISS